MKDSLGEVISTDRKSLRGSQRELPALKIDQPCPPECPPELTRV